MSDKKSYFVPLVKPCDYWDKCSDFLKKCNECELNKTLRQVKEEKEIQRPVQEKGFGAMKENLSERYKQMPKEFKLF